MSEINIFNEFKKLYSKNPEIYFSPGRVNIIGEHTDYNNGLVMPIAINMGTFIAIAKNNDSHINVYSENLDDRFSFDPKKVENKLENSWQNYIKGTIKTVIDRSLSKEYSNVDIYIYSNLPFGAGLSSSASLTTALAYAYNQINKLDLSSLEITKIAQFVEHEYIGTKCGIMDQMACVFSSKDNATLIDCENFSYKNIPFDLSDTYLLICDTNIKHNLAESAYNQRRQDCESIASFNGLQSLRELTDDSLSITNKNLSKEKYLLAKHVFTENNRVLNAANAMQEKDWQNLGQLMYQSHDSLKDDYKVSCDELDYLVELSKTFDGVYGARMTGGGFGGSTIHLVKENVLEKYKDYLEENYFNRFKIKPLFYISKACNGTHKVVNHS
ncbi:galactokinase [Francisella frigiditurris]|uniref:Galactokinase n=1 Tax=Francisella frigiditurris TaxID=1542390 RepID=A0A1J0KVL5_9GAMM|nr:galactokinase [Francisella frigiditurris]APC97714.1 galactokinase [Francisella frigiditurris]